MNTEILRKPEGVTFRLTQCGEVLWTQFVATDSPPHEFAQAHQELMRRSTSATQAGISYGKCTDCFSI